MIAKASILHANEIALLHKKHIPTGFLSSMGIAFLGKLYAYLSVKEILFVCLENDKVLGYVSCSANIKKTYLGFILSNPLYLSVCLIKKVISYQFIKKAFETLRAPFASSIDPETAPEIKAELLSIVVDDSVQKKGIGSQLIKILEEELIKKNIYQYKVVAGAELDKANKLYNRNGFQLFKTINIHDTSISNLYYKKITI